VIKPSITLENDARPARRACPALGLAVRACACAPAGKSVGVHGADAIQQCLNAGLLDEIHVDIAAVLLGSGIRLSDRLPGVPIVLGNPTVIPGIGVTHLRYPLRKT